ILFGVAGPFAQSDGCVQRGSWTPDFLEFAQQGYGITLVPDTGSEFTGPLGQALKTGFVGATGAWNGSCPTNQFADIPRFGVSNARSSDPVQQLSEIYVHYERNLQPQRGADGNFHSAEYQSGSRTLTVYGLCGQFDVPCDHGSIDWDSAWGQLILEHELGHSLGLGHDREDGTCANSNGIMRATTPKNGSLLTDYCRVADDRNCSSAYPGTACPLYAVGGLADGLVNGEYLSI